MWYYISYILSWSLIILTNSSESVLVDAQLLQYDPTSTSSVDTTVDPISISTTEHHVLVLRGYDVIILSRVCGDLMQQIPLSNISGGKGML